MLATQTDNALHMHFKDLLLNVIYSFLEYFYLLIHNLFSMVLAVKSCSSHAWVFSIDLKILSIQPPMRLAIPTHVSADTEFTCYRILLDCGLSLGAPVLNTKANTVTSCFRNTPYSFTWKCNCPKHSKHTCPTKDYLKAIWSFLLTCIWTPETTIPFPHLNS